MIIKNRQDKVNPTMHVDFKAAYSAAERRSLMNRTPIRLAGLFVLGLAAAHVNVNAQNLVLKSNTGTILTQYPLQTSNGCTVVSGGDIEVRTQASAGSTGDGWCPGTVAPPAAITFPVTLAVAPRSLEPGGTVSATWTSANATACEGTVTRDGTGTTVTGWSGVRALSQLAPGLSFAIPTAGEYVFRITCSNPANGATSNTSTALTVSVQEIVGGCPLVSPSFGLTRQLSFVNTAFLQGNPFGNGPVTLSTYNAFFGDWPARTGNRTIAIYPNKYVALSFNTGTVNSTVYGGTPANPNKFGTLETFAPAANSGQILKSFGKCPGQFETDLPMANKPDGSNWCRLQIGQGQWAYAVGISAPFACLLNENTDYFLNATFTNYLTGQSSCSNPEGTGGTNAGSCHWFVQPR